MNDSHVLAGMRVIEASAFVAAPSGGMTLAQLGADVIRIDGLRGGLDRHRWPVTREGASLFWCGLNKGKRSVALDVTRPEGRELAVALVTRPGEDGGMLLTNLPPRGWLDFDQLSARRPDLIQVTLSGDRKGGSAVDYTINPRLGLPFITGPVESEAPVNHVLPAWDLITGQTIAVGLLAAERYRFRTGKGQHVRLSLEDVALASMANLGFVAEAQLALRGELEPRRRYGNDLFGAFGRDFACRDGARVMVVGLTGKQWQVLCQATGLEGAMQEVAKRHGLDFSKEGDRFRGREDIATLLREWFDQHALEDVAQMFDKHGVCWGRYQTLEQLVRDDASCSEANPMFATVQQAGVGEVLASGAPLDFAAVARLRAQPAPVLGAQTEEVLSELLGIGQAEYGRLREASIAA